MRCKLSKGGMATALLQTVSNTFTDYLKMKVIPRENQKCIAGRQSLGAFLP